MSAETYSFETSLEEKTSVEPVVYEKYYVDLNDQNQSNYKNQMLIFDLPSLALQDAYLDLSNSIFRIPMQTTMTSASADFLTTDLQNLVAFKGHSTSIVDSLQIMVDNQVLRTFSSHSEVVSYFNKITSMSKDYENVVASSSLNHALDGGVPTYTDAQGEHQLGNTSVSAKNGRITKFAASSYQGTVNITNKSKSHYVVENAKKITYNYILEIPLKDLDEVFAKIPLLRGFYPKISMQIHTGSCSFTSAAKVITAYTSTTTYGTLPFMLNQASLAETNGILNSATSSLVTIETAILKNSLSGAANPLLGACQLHACFVKPRLDADKMLSRRPPVEINYNQAMFQTLRDVAPNTAFSFQISSSSSKPSYLLIHTRMADSIHMSNTAGLTTFASTPHAVPTSSMASPFSASPMTTKAYSSMTQFQINVGGNPLYTRGALNVDYDFFNDNFRSFNSLSGGGDEKQASGLIDREKWEKLYGYIVVDLKKYEMFSNWVSPKDITIKGICCRE